jgi:DegV family protein with EDD domain
MAVEIVTDSLSDITPEFAKELEITVVPLYVRFGEEVYRDRVEMTTDEFYHRLVNGTSFPTTTQPSPGDFLNVYKKLAKKSDEILVVTVSGMLSGTYQSAMQAKSMMEEEKCRIEVIDSRKVAMSLGLIVIKATKAAKAGANLDELVDLVRKAMPRSNLVVYFDTLKYLAKGGRIGKAQGLLGAMLSIKPILTIKDGEMAPLTRVRSPAAGLDYLYNFVPGFAKIESLAVEHATTPDEADELAERISKIVPKERIYRAVVSPVLGTYAGPYALALTVLEAE